jgi:uncharacterized protein (TIGR02996 family)
VLLKIAHVDDAHDPRYVVVAEPGSYTIGFDNRNDIVLADSTVMHLHARLTLVEDRIVVEPLNGSALFVDDKPLAGPTEVGLAEWIQLGETVLSVLRGDRAPERNHDEHRAASVEEAGFLAALRLDPSDDETRLVYADWLEAAECPVTAGYLRLELAGRVDITTSELVERATMITTPEWRVLVCRGPIGHCDRMQRCPGRWHALAPTREPFTRDCTTCAQPVHYCPDREAVARHGEQRTRVVFDAIVDISSGTDAYLGRHPIAETSYPVPSVFPALDDDETYDDALDDDDDA